MHREKIVLPGGAGLVGQNLVISLLEAGYEHIVVIDKHKNNLEILSRLHPAVECVYADLAEKGAWQNHFEDASVVVMLQAQIGGNNYEDFERNNIVSTANILDLIKKNHDAFLVHISSSVIESVANDFYTKSKTQQENMVRESGVEHLVLRPTLMFGWFDRKHLGWLSRFMKKIPVFPIPGHGRYMRQPLYVGDFCNIIISGFRQRMSNGIYNISGQEQVDYIDIIRAVKKAVNSRTLIVRIPYSLFYFLLWLWAVFDSDPPFTTQQLQALVAGDEFEVIDWQSLFKVDATPFEEAIQITFNDSRFSPVVLDF